jgi:hypothetical protein
VQSNFDVGHRRTGGPYLSRHSTDSEFVAVFQKAACCHRNRRFKLDKRRLLFIRMHNETLSVAMRVSNPDCSPVESNAETQPQLQPALLKLSAMISQYFIVLFRVALLLLVSVVGASANWDATR